LTRTIVFGLLCFVCAIKSSVAGEPRKKMQIALPAVSPWIVDKKGQPDGLIVGFLKELLAHSDLVEQSHIKIYPYSRAKLMIKDGRSDLTVMAKESLVGARDIQTVGCLYRLEVVLIRERLHDKTPQLVGRLRGAMMVPSLLKGPIKVIDLYNYEQGFSMLSIGRIDAMVHEKTSANYLISRFGTSRDYVMKTAGKIEIALHVSNYFARHNRDVLSALKRAFRRSVLEGHHLKVLQDYYMSLGIKVENGYGECHEPV